MTPDTRLIESAFPLKQVSRASVHEKSVRHGHLSTLHVWPARRPLAASRAAVLATLLRAPDGEEARRRRLLARLAAILRWGGEDPAEIERFRVEVREAFGGRALRVLDPFEGDGAIPLEAMRLGCDVAAADLNPVAWFLLRCTLTTRRRWPGRAGRKGKDYRPPTAGRSCCPAWGKEELDALHAEIPFGLPNEPICPDRPSPNFAGGVWPPRLRLRHVALALHPAVPAGGRARCSTPMSAEAPWRP